MVGVEVGHDYHADILRYDAQFAELWPNLLGGFDIEADRQTIIRMPHGEVTRLRSPGRLARIHNDDSLRVFNDPGTNRQPLRPMAVDKHSQDTSQLSIAL
jgi:hypothetical protein